MKNFKQLKMRLFWHIFKNIGSQIIYNELLQRTLSEMNYGNGAGVDVSGEKKAMQYVKDNTAKNRIIFDVGANIGNYTRNLNTVMSGVIYAFEPSPQTFALLKDNLAGNANIQLNNVGLSDKVCTMPLFSDTPTSGITSVYNRRLKHFNLNVTNQGEAHFTTLDKYCNEHNIDHIDFLKMDVEGHELAVLNGASEMLEKNAIDYIQFEFGGCNIDSHTFFQDFWYMLHNKYRIYRILRDGLYEITQYTEYLEIFICTNYLAERIKQ